MILDDELEPRPEAGVRRMAAASLCYTLPVSLLI
jgi:hypothetical protein